MKSAITIALTTVLLAGSTAFAVDVIPKRTEFSRYQAMLDHSPFAIATAAALPAATPSFAKDLYIANAARSPEGDLVTLNSASDKNFKEYLSTKGPNEHGYSIANIEWSERIGATKVTISKDGQFATVTFNQALLSVTPGGGGVVPGFTQPNPPTPVAQPAAMYPPGTGVQPTPALPITRPAVPNLPTPPPRVRGVIPRNPNAAAPAPGVVATPPLPPNATADE